ncbi:flagellar biosynthetic protein FliO [Blastopirellula sp. JC732]|uniref:Flagellar biosynthetic protein FliO n=1 Tax=Blastopirellula sediminis TaxID=2894196 RepID=A0A9X1MRF2_9BACT|nr:flagellar biosynthetic protein FliO [Blastopirellula sediminis]MCC9605665.1 flagellar biosynthetic protein FliO [Blastopirellula sediminis]MCC9631035.1 flagellar biosynthetic protein FliO [Blastopirellula sediminis]
MHAITLCLVLATAAADGSSGQMVNGHAAVTALPPMGLPQVEPAPRAHAPQETAPKPATADATDAPLALPKRSEKPSTPVGSILPSAESKQRTATIVASLMLVVGLFLIFAWAGKKKMPSANTRLPKEVVQVLGRTQLQGRQQLQLVRVGSRLLLLSVTPHGAETLTEISDPLEVESLLVHLRQNGSGNMSATFQDVLQQMGEKPTRGFLEA